MTDNKIQQVDGGMRMFRVWKVTGDGMLAALVAEHTWKPGINVCHEVPKLGSTGKGFHGFNFYNQMKLQEKFGDTGQTELIGGTMICFGRMVVAEHGGRVEKAIVESIIEPPGMPESYISMLFQIASNYSCHIITEERALKLKTGKVPYYEGKELYHKDSR